MEEWRKEMNESMESSKIEIGIIACASNASNTGSLTSRVALELAKMLGEKVGICSLPAIATNVPRQTNLVKSIPILVVIDGCHNECAKKILDNVKINPSIYINLEYDLDFKKEGPFSTFNYKEDHVKSIVGYVLSKIKKGDEINE
jgi:uncharacterized metal-binding protein